MLSVEICSCNRFIKFVTLPSSCASKSNKIRLILYKLAKYLGDIQSVISVISKQSLSPIFKRIGRRIYGKIASRGHNVFK